MYLQYYQGYQVITKPQNCRNKGFSKFFFFLLKGPDPYPYTKLRVRTGSPKTYESYGSGSW